MIRWLALAALADWLIGRTLTRSAIFVPKPPPVIAAYRALTLLGQLAFTLNSLLALVVLVWLAWRALRTRDGFGLPAAWLSLLVLSLIFLVRVPQGGWALGHHLLVLATIGMISARAWNRAGRVEEKIAWTLPALALAAGQLYSSSHTLYAALGWPGPPPFATAVFNLGEAFAVLSPIALWWAYGRGEGRHPYAWAALPALAFAGMRLANPAMTGILSIWSLGLTLYLPWPAYAVSLWLAAAAVLASRRRGDLVGTAILLLAAGGYAAQISTHVFLGLIALWLLAAPAAPIPDSSPVAHPARPLACRVGLTG